MQDNFSLAQNDLGQWIENSCDTIFETQRGIQNEPVLTYVDFQPGLSVSLDVVKNNLDQCFQMFIYIFQQPSQQRINVSSLPMFTNTLEILNINFNNQTCPEVELFLTPDPLYREYN